MSGERIVFPQFRDEQADSHYPFADTATLRADDAAAVISTDTFVDAVFYPIGGGKTAHISRVVVSTNNVTIFVETAAPVVTIAATYDPLRTHTLNNVLTFYDQYNRPAGVLVFNNARIAEIYQWGFGTYNFTTSATQFVATACIPAQEPGVRGLTVNGTEFITGDVTFAGDGGVVLSVENEDTIRVDVVGVALFTRFACREANKEPPAPRFISTINGCPADEFGNFAITASDRGVADGDNTVLRVYPTDYGLVIDAVGGSEI